MANKQIVKPLVNAVRTTKIKDKVGVIPGLPQPFNYYYTQTKPSLPSVIDKLKEKKNQDIFTSIGNLSNTVQDKSFWFNVIGLLLGLVLLLLSIKSFLIPELK